MTVPADVEFFESPTKVPSPRNPRYMYASDVEGESYVVFFPEGQCNWCGAPLTGRAKRWCPHPKGRGWYPGVPSRCGQAYREYWWNARPAFQRAVLLRDNFTCQACGAAPKMVTKYPREIERPDLGAFHIDHIAPLSKGGKTEIANLQTLCANCNLVKGNRPERLEAKIAQAALGGERQ